MAARRHFAFAVFLTATLLTAQVVADPASEPYLNLPITQSVNPNGSIRYAVLIKVGDRWVKALIDTGSMGLRVLPPVLPGDFTGIRSEIAFGAGFQMDGIAVLAPVQIGSVTGKVPVEIVYHIACVNSAPNCNVTNLSGDSFLIGGDGYAYDGYSAILGIGFRGGDLENPLEALKIKRWIIDLPRPFENADGHLILDPDPKVSSGFTMLARHGTADAAGCIKGGPLPEEKCGTVLFDTGAPGISVSYEGLKTSSIWDDGTTGTLSFTADAKTSDDTTSNDKTFKLDFHGGKTNGIVSVSTTPLDPHAPLEPFIMAGLYPFLSYDILYDVRAHTVGLKVRDPVPPPPNPDGADPMQGLKFDP